MCNLTKIALMMIFTVIVNSVRFFQMWKSTSVWDILQQCPVAQASTSFCCTFIGASFQIIIVNATVCLLILLILLYLFLHDIGVSFQVDRSTGSGQRGNERSHSSPEVSCSRIYLLPVLRNSGSLLVDLTLVFQVIHLNGNIA